MLRCGSKILTVRTSIEFLAAGNCISVCSLKRCAVKDTVSALPNPEPILRDGPNGIEEPYENLVVDVPQEHVGAVMELVGTRKGQMQSMTPLEEGHVRVEFVVPARGLVGFSSTLTETKKVTVLCHHAFSHYGPWAERLRKGRP